MAKTQLELLIEVNSIYREIGELTELLLQVDPHEQVTLIHRRGALILQCQSLLQKLDTLPLGNNPSELMREKEKLHEAIMKTTSQDSIIQESLQKSMREIEIEMSHGSKRKRAAGFYQLHSRKER